MSKKIKIVSELKVKAKYDVIVAGGGVSGVAAALTAKKRGLKVLLVEKQTVLGGLATSGLVNYFVPMCNGRGKQIIFGLADKWFRESMKYGFQIISDEWKDGEPKEPTNVRMTCRFSPNIFALQLTEMIKNAGVDILFDCIVTETVMDGNVVKGVVTESKSGKEYYECERIIDVTGDADILRRSGVPTVLGENYYTYISYKISLDSCKKAYEKQDIKYATSWYYGGNINLYGHNQPEDKPLWSGTTVEDVTDYLVDNQTYLLEKLKKDDPKSRDIVNLPHMPDFRQTCHIDGEYTLKEEDRYKHFEDSICAVNDFDRRDFLYEIPYRCLINKDFPNIITAGRSASGEGYAWGVVRVIPVAILTGQAAAEAVALSLESDKPLSEIDIKTLQERLEKDDNIMIHFPDDLVPEDKDTIIRTPDEGHI